MIIRTDQQTELDSTTMDSVYQACLRFMKKNFPQMLDETSTAEHPRRIKSVIGFSQKRGIQRDDLVQKLVALEYKYGFMVDGLSRELDEIMEYPERSEEDKVNYFHKQLMFERAEKEENSKYG